jgi:hypothetical protein
MVPFLIGIDAYEIAAVVLGPKKRTIGTQQQLHAIQGTGPASLTPALIVSPIVPSPCPPKSKQATAARIASAFLAAPSCDSPTNRRANSSPPITRSISRQTSRVFGRRRAA